MTPYNTGYEEREDVKEDPFDPHKAKWRVIPETPWGEDAHEGEISGTIKANGETFALFKIPNKETLKWLRERLNQDAPTLQERVRELTLRKESPSDLPSE